jgi:ferredoxin
MERRLREAAGRFLARPDALCFLGWEASPAGGTRPAALRDPAEAERLVWNRDCHANLAALLPRFRGQEGVVGVAVKGCDARALRELLRANQAERAKLFVVGVPCAGLAGPDGESLALRCYGCRYPEGFEYDEALGPMESPDLPETPAAEVELAAMTPEERRRFWEAEFAKCIRCDACRKACYACFCPECIFESARPRWIAGRGSRGEKFFFHAVRAFHLAGRCVGCGECLRACPAGVRLDLLNQALDGCLDESLSFQGAGLTESDPPLQAFSPEDREPSGAEGS